MRHVLLSLLFLATTEVWGQGPPESRLIWEDQFDLAGRTDLSSGIAVSGHRAVAIGVGSLSTQEVDLLVRAYDTATGTLEWQDQAPLASGRIGGVVIDDLGHNVFAAGYSGDGAGGTDFLVRAYDARTGNRLWEDVANKGRDDLVQGIAAGRYGVFVVGYGGNVGGSSLDFLVRAYDKTSGALLWEDQVDKGSDDAAWRVATQGRMVFVAGSTVSSPDGSRNLMLRAYDSVSGNLAWESSFTNGLPVALAVANGRVYVAGGLTVGGGFLVAYDRLTGALIWSKTTDPIRDLAASKSRVFAAGSAGGLLRAYDAKTGALVWEAQPVDSGGGEDLALAIELSRGLIFLVGSSFKPFEYSEFLVRAYDAGSGELVWEDRAHRTIGDVPTAAYDVATAGQRVFAVGLNINLAGNPDFLIRVYDATPGPPQQRKQGQGKD